MLSWTATGLASIDNQLVVCSSFGTLWYHCHTELIKTLHATRTHTPIHTHTPFREWMLGSKVKRWPEMLRAHLFWSCRRSPAGQCRRPGSTRRRTHAETRTCLASARWHRGLWNASWSSPEMPRPPRSVYRLGGGDRQVTLWCMTFNHFCNLKRTAMLKQPHLDFLESTGRVHSLFSLLI